MTVWTDLLCRGGDLPLGTVVHIGAGAGAVLSDVGALTPQRLLLVEGDPDSAAALQRAAAGRAGVEVHARVVSPRAGRVDWHRYNLPVLNGPLSAEPLRSFYPRLSSTGHLALPGVALADLLAEFGVERQPGLRHVLLLDVPGQEAALLGELPDEWLQRFDLLVLRGCREVLPPWGESAGACGALAERGFRCDEGVAQGQPLWPLQLWRFDAQARRNQLLSRRVAELEAAMALGLRVAESERQARLAELAILQTTEAERDKHAEWQASQVAALATERDAWSRAARERTEQLEQAGRAQAEMAGRLAETEAELGRAQAEMAGRLAETEAELGRVQAQLADVDKKATWRAGQIDVLTRERDAQAEAVQRLAEAEAELGRVQALLAEVEKKAAWRAGQIDALTRERDTQAGLATQRLAELEALGASVAAADRVAAERADRLAELERAFQEQVGLAAERQARLDALTRAHLDLEATAGSLSEQLDEARKAQAETEKRAAWRASQLDAMKGERDEQGRLVALQQTASEEFAALRARLEGELGELRTQVGLVARERDEIEKKASWRSGQIEQLTRERNDLTQQAADRQRQIDEQQQGLAGLQRQVETLQGRVDGLTQEKSQLLADRDALGKQSAERQAQVQERSQRLQRLEAELSDAAMRNELLQEEVLKAEAQLDVIKDLFLKEPTL